MNLLKLVILLLETTRKQIRFETPKFIKRCNCIEMIRKKITWIEDVTDYNHKISKSLGALKKLIKDNEKLFKTTPIYLCINFEVATTKP
jgi:hypothetical protein